MKRILFAASLLVAAGTAGACTGSFGDPGGNVPTPGGTTGPQACNGARSPGPAPMRRMTRTEYNNTVRDLLGDTSAPATGFPPDEQALGFDNNAGSLGVTQLLAEGYMTASEQLAKTATAKMSALFPCDNAKLGDTACAQSFITMFGKKVFRRPVTSDEIARLTSVYAAGSQTDGYAVGIQLTLEAMLQSPHFLYRVEFGAPPPAGDTSGILALTDYERASRLSYFLWNSMPDDALMAAADASQLETADQIAAQARRMLKDPRARGAIANFHAQWLELTKFDRVSKNPAVFPEYTQSIHDAQKVELATFVDDAFWNQGTLDALLTSPYTFVNTELAAFYGLPAPQGTGFVRANLDPGSHAGFLTQGALMSLLAKQDQTSPVHRGKFVREQLLCHMLPPPPANIVIKPPDIDPTKSTRERFAEHSKNPMCAGCHHLMDPVGFGFENYDPIGRYRTMDGTFPVDASGQLLDTKDIDGPFNGAVDLAHRLAGSEQVKECMVTQWFRFSYGRGSTDEDTCSLSLLQTKFAEAKYDLRELLVALTQTDTFLYRKPVVPSGGP